MLDFNDVWEPVTYNAKDFTAIYNDQIWHEIWRVFPGLKCIATVREFTFFVNDSGSHYFTIERGED